MANLKDVPLSELLDRYHYLVDKYVKLTVELAPLLEQFGKYRKELQAHTSEFMSRNVKVKDSEELVRLMEEEAKKHNVNVPEIPSSEGHSTS